MADLFIVDLRNLEINCVFDYDHWVCGTGEPFSWGGHHPLMFDHNRILSNWKVDPKNSGMHYVLFEDISDGYLVINSKRDLGL